MKIKFTDIEINEIVKLYMDNFSTTDIGKLYNISKTPINRILKEKKILRNGVSDGRKIVLDEDQKNKIKYLYLTENKNCNDIGEILNLNRSFIDKYLKSVNYRRSKSEAAKISTKGRTHSIKTREKMKKIQRDFVLTGKRKQIGGVCKFYNVNGLTCQGTYEKKYIEVLISQDEILPVNGDLIITPFGGYYPDFKYSDKYIEIKSKYTYDILCGLKKSRWTKKYETKQMDKIKWVNDNMMPVEIIVLDKNNINVIKI